MKVRKHIKGKYYQEKKRNINYKKISVISAFVLILSSIVFINSPKDNIFKSSYKKLLANNGIYTEEIKSIEITSDDYDEPGSFKVTKSAEWTDYGKAKLTITADSIIKPENNNKKDIILVMDISGSMEGTKLDKAQEDAIDLTNNILTDNNNKIGLITFDTNAEIVFNLSNDINTINEKINSLTTKGATNYNDALKKVDNMLENYQEQNNRDLIVLFLTDGNPCEDTPNEVSTYKILKEKYSSLTIQGIQYEMGSSITEALKNISDKQFNASIDTLGNILIEASTNPIPYDEFVITDYIDTDYFEEPNENDIKTSFGSYELDGNKITWNLGDSYATGNKVTLTINLTQKERYIDEEGFYPTNEKEFIKYKLGEENETISSHDTPVLKNTYEVIYNSNAPEGCIVETPESKKQTINKVVTMKTPELYCDGYKFNGWEIANDDDIKYINKSSFKMPARKIYINGTWTKQSIDKSMDGTVYTKPTLYNVLKNEAKIGTYAKKYNGEHADAYDRSGTEDIYYWYGSGSSSGRLMLDKNNVIFANHCWQMIRTTDTGGVKLIYNGVVKDNKCLSNRGTHEGYSSRTTQKLSTAYYYGTSYTYDSTNKTFTLSGEVTTGEIKTGEYTCKATSADSTCTTLYYLDILSGGTTYYVLPIINNSYYPQFGALQYNQLYSSPADVGYMYNIRHTPSSSSLTSSKHFLSNYFDNNIDYYYADSYDYGEINAYKYTLINPYKVTSTNEYTSLIGKYTIRSSSETGNSTQVYYIAEVNGTKMYYIQLLNGETLEDVDTPYIFGDGYEDNGDGTYKLTSIVSYKKSEWRDNYTNVVGKYTCANSSDSCEIMYYITNSSFNSITVIGNNKLYGKSYSYELNRETNKYEYILSDTISFPTLSNLHTHHYTCFNNTGRCEILHYVYFSNGSYIYYINLTNGNSVEDLLNEMLYAEDVNTTNSIIKTGIDAWYKRNLLEYDNYLEDTVFCNDRSIKNLNGWNPNGGNVSNYLLFKEYNSTSDLSCINETDRFSILNEKAKLIYKIGMVSNTEEYLFNNNSARKTQANFWTSSPYYFNYSYADNRYISTSGWIDNSHVGDSFGVRPVISLKPGIEYSDGDGSMAHPYIIDTEGD